MIGRLPPSNKESQPNVEAIKKISSRIGKVDYLILFLILFVSL